VRHAAPTVLPIFRSKLQGEILALILIDPARSWTIDELAGRTGHPYQTVATEVRRLQEADILRVRNIGRTKLLTANESSPYVGPLTELVMTAFGPPLVIGEEFETVAGIEQLFIYGSWAARDAGEPGPAPNDIDLLVIGQPDRDAIYEAAKAAQHRIGREVNTAIRTAEQWAAATDGFTQKVKESPMVEIPYHHDDA
jgi:predicted nucleotidyltransferase